MVGQMRICIAGGAVYPLDSQIPGGVSTHTNIRSTLGRQSSDRSPIAWA